MRYSPRHGFFFVHIPKCAGTSVARALADDAQFPAETIQQDLAQVRSEQLPGAFRWCVHHEHLGNVHLAHLPLSYLAEHFPNTWELFDRSEKFVVLRDPRARFLSAVMQRLREFHGLSSSDLKEPAIRREADQVCQWLAERDSFCDLEYIHFSRQSDYVYLEDRRIIDRCFAINRLDRMSAWMTEQFGTTPPADTHANPTVRPAGWFQPVAPAVIGLYKRAVPISVRDRMTPYWRQLGLLKRVESETTFTLNKSTEQFIENYYAKDRALYLASLEA